MAADLDKIIARLQDEKTPFSKISRQGIVGAVERGNLSFEQANKLIDDAQAQAAGTAPAQEPPDVTADDLSRIDRGRGLSAAERNSPPATAEDAIRQFEASKSGDEIIEGSVTLSDGTTGRVKGTQAEIDALMAELEAEITVRREKAAQAGDQQAGDQLNADEKAEQDIRQETFLQAVASQGIANAELGLSILTGSLAEPVSGIAGILALAGSGGDADLAAEWVAEVGDTMTFTPRTKRGKDTAAAIAAPLMKLEEKIDDMSVKGARGNPYAAATIKTILLGAPELVSGALGGIRRAKVVGKLDKAQKFADAHGINTEPTAIKSSLVDAVERMTPDEFAANQQSLRTQLVDAEAAQKTAVTRKFDEAKTSDAYVNATSIEDFSRGLRDHLIDEGFDLETMKGVRNTLNEMDNIRTRKPGRGARDNIGEFGAGVGRTLQPGRVVDVQLNDLQLIRKRINRRFTREGESNAALSLMKNKLDDFLDTQFKNDAIRGDADAITRWKDAREAFIDYKKNFSEDRFIRKMVEEDATPEQYRRWLVGSSAMAARPQVAATVRKLKGILGENSPQMDAIRMDLLHDVARPIFEGRGGKPNFKGFVSNYDKVIQRNPSLVRELGLDSSELQTLRDFAQAADRVQARRPFGLDPSTVVARYFFGHKIARAAVRVALVRGLIDRMFKVGETGRKMLLAEAIGQPGILTQPLIPRGGFVAGSIIANEFTEVERTGEERAQRKLK
jgi:hypothetical protein